MCYQTKVRKYDKYSKKVIKYLHILNKCHIFVTVKGNNNEREHDIHQNNLERNRMED